jgi:hypothetical protein
MRLSPLLATLYPKKVTDPIAFDEKLPLYLFIFNNLPKIGA